MWYLRWTRWKKIRRKVNGEMKKKRVAATEAGAGKNLALFARGRGGMVQTQDEERDKVVWRKEMALIRRKWAQSQLIRDPSQYTRRGERKAEELGKRSLTLAKKERKPGRAPRGIASSDIV